MRGVAPRLPDVGVDCSACLSCGMVVLLIIAGCRLFHSLPDSILHFGSEIYWQLYFLENTHFEPYNDW